MKLALVPGLYRALEADHGQPRLDPRLSLAEEKAIFNQELLYVSGAQKPIHGQSTMARANNTEWVLESVQESPRIKFSENFPDGFSRVTKSEIQSIIQDDPCLPAEMVEKLTRLIE